MDGDDPVNPRMLPIANAVVAEDWNAVQLLDEHRRLVSQAVFAQDLLDLLTTVDMMGRVSILYEVFSRLVDASSVSGALVSLYSMKNSVSLAHISALAHSRQWGDQQFDLFCDFFDQDNVVENRHRIVAGLIHSVRSQARASRYLEMLNRVGCYGDKEKQQTLERFTRKAREHIGETVGLA